MTDIKDYLHLYLGCLIVVPDEKEPVRMVAINEQSCFAEGGCDYQLAEVRPILRPLWDMTKLEFAGGLFDNDLFEFIGTSASMDNQYEMFIRERRAKEDRCWYPENYKFFLKHGFDIFGLIESGLAIDKTKFNRTS